MTTRNTAQPTTGVGIESTLQRLLSYFFAFSIPPFITILFLVFVVKPIVPSETNGANFFADVLERIPTHYATYVFLSAILGLRAFSHMRAVRRARLDFEEQKGSSDRIKLTDLEWWACLDLRRRALALRMRADFILYCGVLAMVFGIHFVIFSLPGISDDTPTRVAESIFENEFGDRINCIAEGQCAYKMTGGFQFVPPQPTVPDYAETDEALLHVYKLDGTRTESRHPREFPPGVELVATALSRDGRTAIIGGSDGSVWLTDGGRQSWKLQVPGLARREELTAAALSADGRTAIVGGDDGTVTLTTDGGGIWVPQQAILAPQEEPTAVALSADGWKMIVAGNQGSVSMSKDRGSSWKRQEPGLAPREEVVAAALSAGGWTVIVAGNDGTVSMTTDGGDNWVQQQPNLASREEPTAVALSADGWTAIVAGDEGSVSMTRERGNGWSHQQLDLRAEEKPTAAALSADGMTAIVGADDGSVWLTTGGGRNWGRVEPWAEPDTFLGIETLGLNAQSAFIMTVSTHLSVTDPNTAESLGYLGLSPREKVRTTASSSDGSAFVFGGDKGTVLLTTNGGKNWHTKRLDLKPREWLRVSAVSADDADDWDDGPAIVAGDEGSVWLTRDAGRTWNSLQLDLEPREGLTAAALSDDGSIALVGSDRGSAWMVELQEVELSPEKVLARESAEEIDQIWFRSTVNRLDTTSEATESVGIILTDNILTDNESMFVLKEHPELATWRNRPISEVRSSMQNDEYLQNSQLLQDISEFLSVTDMTISSNNGKGEWFATILNRLTILQAATLAIIFFFVQMMIRLYQYNFRMAAFCESRADAVLVARKFIGNSHIRFDELVQALAPDSYDFKTPPRSPFDRVQKPQDS